MSGRAAPRRKLAPCTVPGCPQLVRSGRCQEHARQADRQRGSRHERGYDHRYVKARDHALHGATHCTTCGDPFTPDNPATGGHVKDIRQGGTTADGIQPECRRCNYGWRREG